MPSEPFRLKLPFYLFNCPKCKEGLLVIDDPYLNPKWWFPPKRKTDTGIYLENWGIVLKSKKVIPLSENHIVIIKRKDKKDNIIYCWFCKENLDFLLPEILFFATREDEAKDWDDPESDFRLKSLKEKEALFNLIKKIYPDSYKEIYNEINYYFLSQKFRQ